MARECRDDGRCQYAIDSGAEGLGHCPKGKCVMPEQEGNEMDKSFDDWWATLTPAEHKLLGRSNALYVWICASAARREKDAKIADSWDNGSAGNVAKTIARCIRAQGE